MYVYARACACTSMRAQLAGPRGNNAWGSPAKGLPTRPATPHGTRVLLYLQAEVQLPPASRWGSRVWFFPTAVGGFNRGCNGGWGSRPLGPAPEVVGLGSERSLHGGHSR